MLVLLGRLAGLLAWVKPCSSYLGRRQEVGPRKSRLGDLHVHAGRVSPRADGSDDVGHFTLEIAAIMTALLRCVALLGALSSACGFVVTPVRLQQTVAVAASSLPTESVAALPVQRALITAPRSAAPAMGLFGLGAPELAVIGAVALFILGPDKLKELAKDVGKVSAELKQVPEEFNKGMEVGSLELEKKKMMASEETVKPTDTPDTPA